MQRKMSYEISLPNIKRQHNQEIPDYALLNT
jgi:hypothetical protein